MCYQGVIAVPEKAATWFESREWPGINRSRGPNVSRALLDRLSVGYRAYWVGGSSCACGRFSPGEDADEGRDAKLWNKFASKGWSVAKTRRTFEQAGGGKALPASPGGFHEPVPSHVAEVVREAGECGICAELLGGAAKTNEVYKPELEVRCGLAEYLSYKVMMKCGALVWVGR